MENKNDDKNVFDIIKDQYKQKKHQQLEFESQMTERMAEEKEKNRREYEKKLRDEKIELLRMKQNNTNKSEIIPVEQPEEKIELTFGKKISNFFYHNKLWLGLFCGFAFIAGFLIYDLATKKNPDIVVLFFDENDELDKIALNEYILQFCEDFNDNGEILSDVYYIPYTGDDQADYASGTSTKLMAELQSAEAMIVICDEKMNEAFNPEYDLVNLEELYPDNPHIEKWGFYLKDTDLAEKIGYEKEFEDDVYIGIRKPQKRAWADEAEMQEAYDDSIIVLDKIIADLS